jgi:hypothetical protein
VNTELEVIVLHNLCLQQFAYLVMVNALELELKY